jgi:hypothetical protein
MQIAHCFANLPGVAGVKIAAGPVVALGDALIVAVDQVDIAAVING